MTTDYKRWEQDSSHDLRWDRRTEMLATLIPNRTHTILELGAGLCSLKTRLKPHHDYTPMDLVDRGEGSIVADLNELPYEFLDQNYDVIFISGVLEYVRPIWNLIDYITKRTNVVILSYAIKEGIAPRPDSGFISPMHSGQVLRAFDDAGFKVTRSAYCDGQELYRLEHENS